MRIKSFDGTSLSVKIIGEGRPVVLVHGFLSSGKVNWEDYGTATLLAERGFQVILPDLRGHGGSDVPTEPSAYPPDVLARDLATLIEHLGLADYDLVGYSLGSRTVLRAVVAHGLVPRRLVLAGMGAAGIVDAGPRIDWFVETIRNRETARPLTPEGRVARFLKTTGTNPDAAIYVLQSHVNTPPDVLARLDLPVLVVAGEKDDDNGSAAELAKLIPGARYAAVPGDHMSAITVPEFRMAIADFLSE
ncbi:alpha/beta fold hydrolase [Pedomonas mirosovicensis]|uniref:alpha/beta fold hydrolase n=1 Tax=Pedomonas mirosovicensis TaxID=2908641 RepID=UPI002169AA88|nr:alpha/beta hydrolase [Pedomonas mirosovicensis]MCH8686099.1 alpha/beta hydrolase [Pedomonas mirosovicensis]